MHPEEKHFTTTTTTNITAFSFLLASLVFPSYFWLGQLTKSQPETELNR